MPCYNSANFIADSIFSIIEQTYTDLELICIDDKSSDDTLVLLRKYESKDSRIRVIESEINGGPGYSRNLGIRVASGRFIAFCDSDDRWNRTKLEVQLERMRIEGASMSFGNYLVNNGFTSKLRSYNGKVGYYELLTHNYIGCLTVVVDRHYIKDFSFSELRKRQDWLTWLNILKSEQYIVINIQEVLAEYIVRSGSVSSSILSNIKYTYLVYRNLSFNFISSFLLTAKFLITHLVQKI